MKFVPMKLNDDFKYVLDAIEQEGRSAFVTGRAGTGKSTLLRLFRDTTRKKTVVLAPTGVAALNVKGQTIHSFFKFPPRPLTRKDIRRRPRFIKFFKKIEVIIIDEISMVRADMLDAIDAFLRVNRENPLQPFGGVQMVFFGDLFQLPPVVASDEERMFLDYKYDSPYFFSSEVFRSVQDEMELVELKKVYRQNERHFIRLLNAIRTNDADIDDLEDLNDRYQPDFDPEEFHITLSTINRIVNRINTQEMDALSHPEVVFPGEITGEFSPKLFPTDLILKLKLDARVMFIKNDVEKEYVNGTIGKVVDLSPDKIVVEVSEENRTRTVVVEKEEWEISKYKMVGDSSDKIEKETVGSFTQYPLRPAWAITIHKSQGKTFDRIVIDMGRGAFEHGQTYVALSRCRTLDGIILKKKITPRDILVDERVVDFYDRWFR